MVGPRRWPSAAASTVTDESASACIVPVGLFDALRAEIGPAILAIAHPLLGSTSRHERLPMWEAMFSAPKDVTHGATLDGDSFTHMEKLLHDAVDDWTKTSSADVAFMIRRALQIYES